VVAYSELIVRLCSNLGTLLCEGYFYKSSMALNLIIASYSDQIMRSHHQLLDIFPTFAMPDGGDFRKWIADPRLQRNMEESMRMDALQLKQVWLLCWDKNGNAQILD
jgi:hypothetical protein